jgi:2-polyprenyl-3-methyl-5-hydroxy-6-metoxy-1,4-benzoquinol methylase
LGIAGPRVRILDLGCGNGTASKFLATKGHQVLGVDISRDALQKARELDVPLPTVQAACDGPLPFATSSFDAVYCTEVIEHVLDPETLVQESHRILKPQGQFFLSAPYHGLIKNLLLAGLAFEKHFDVLGGHIRFFTVPALEKLLVSNGFKVERVWRLGRFWPIWMDSVLLARKP